VLINALQPLLVRLPGGDVHLQPGVPVEFPDEQGHRLLAKVPNKVRRVTIPSPPINQSVYWNSVDGKTRSGVLDFIHTESDTSTWAFVTTENGNWVAVNLRYLKGTFKSPGVLRAQGGLYE
jgi:hypothetical protein